MAKAKMKITLKMLVEKYRANKVLRLVAFDLRSRRESYIADNLEKFSRELELKGL